MTLQTTRTVIFDFAQPHLGKLTFSSTRLSAHRTTSPACSPTSASRHPFRLSERKSFCGGSIHCRAIALGCKNSKYRIMVLLLISRKEASERFWKLDNFKDPLVIRIRLLLSVGGGKAASEVALRPAHCDLHGGRHADVPLPA